MSTVLYGTYLSPFVRKTMIVLKLKGIEYKLQPVVPAFAGNGTATGAPDDWDVISPLGLIPAFRDEHVAVSDSSVICEYLDARYPEKPLRPNDPATRARCNWYEEYADTAMAVAMVYNVFGQLVLRKLMLKKEADVQLAETSMKEKVPKILDYLEQQLNGVEYLVDNRLSIADISVLNPMINISYAGYSIDAKRWKNLDAFYRRMTDMPVIADIIAKERSIIDANRS